MYYNCLLGLFRLILLPVLFFLSVSSSVFAANISIYDSVEKSLRHDPRIKSLNYRVEAAEFDLKRERSLYLPRVDMTLGYGLEQHSDKVTRRSGARPSDSDWDPLGDASLRITQRLYDGGELRQRVSIQQTVLDVAGLKHQGVRNFVILDTINAHLSVLRHREVEVLATRNLEAHEHMIQLLKEREQAGAGSIADVAQAQARFSQARAAWLIVQKDLQHAQTTYHRLTDSNPAPEHFGYQACHDIFPATLEQALDLAKRFNPELKVAEVGLIEAEAREKLSRSAYRPKLDLQLSSRFNDQLEGDSSWKNTNDIMLNLNWNLFNGGHDRALTAAAMARRNQVRADRENLLLELYEQIAVIWSTYQSLEDHRKILDEAIIYSYSALDAYLQQFSVSQRSLLELLDAQNNYFQTATQLINVSINRDLAGYELLGLIGDIHISQCLASDNKDPFGLYQLRGITTTSAANPYEYQHNAEPQKDDTADLVQDKKNENTTECPFDFLDRWAMTWSAQDVNGYFSFYSKDFIPEGNMSLEHWEKQRYNRLTKPSFIEVLLTDFVRRPSFDDKVQVEVIQYYRNNIYSDQTHKLFDLQQSGSSWEIIRERSLATTQVSTHY
jgi:adhesin transport system outer membrane protein